MLGHGCYRTSGTHPHPAPGLPVSAFLPLATLSPGNSLPLLDAVSGHLPQVSMSRIFNGNGAPALRYETVLPARVLETEGQSYCVFSEGQGLPAPIIGSRRLDTGCPGLWQELLSPGQASE